MAKHRYEFLDGIRGVAAVMVVVFHFTQHSSFPIARNAYFAVDLFFCLSGFVLAKAYAQRITSRNMSFASFLSKRAIRLYPMFATGMVLGVIALLVARAHGQTTYSVASILGSAIANFLYLPFPNKGTITVGDTSIPGPIFPANNPAWTLFFEMAVNVIFFFLWRMGWAPKRVLVSLVGICGAILAFAIYMNLGSSGWGSAPRHPIIGFDRTMLGFTAGVLIAFAPAVNFHRRSHFALGVVLVLTVVGLGFLDGGRLAFALAVATTPIIVYLGAGISSWSWGARWAGELSYPLYCVHFPILLMLDTLGYLGTTTNVASGIIISILVAFVCLFVIDFPLRRFFNGLALRSVPKT